MGTSREMKSFFFWSALIFLQESGVMEISTEVKSFFFWSTLIFSEESGDFFLFTDIFRGK